MLFNFRNKFFPFLLVSFLCSSFLYSQQNIDSLKSVLNSVPQDSNRVRILNRLAWNLRSMDPESAMTYAEEAEKLSGKIS
ncbi:MAG TPA: hypothetical protein VFJ43_13575, partial [Bacteroidia bacterium]|nr:hypothetical protein [Bacteroidia bacterium]